MTEAEYKGRREKMARLAREENISQENADLAEVLGTEAGRRLFVSILGTGRVFGTVFDVTDGDPIRLAYETGRREFAVKLYSKANIQQPALVLKAIQEWNALSAERRRRFDALDREYENGKEQA